MSGIRRGSIWGGGGAPDNGARSDMHRRGNVGPGSGRWDENDVANGEGSRLLNLGAEGTASHREQKDRLVNDPLGSLLSSITKVKTIIYSRRIRPIFLLVATLE